MVEQLKFVPFSSALEAGFWHTLTKKKLEIYKLNESAKHLTGFYYNGNQSGIPCQLNLDYNSLDQESTTPKGCFPARGQCFIYNTAEGFSSSDKSLLLGQAADRLFKDIRSGRAIQDPSLLSPFLLLVFADLKKYHYSFWFAFPALVTPTQATTLSRPPCKLAHYCTPKQIENLKSSYDAFAATQLSTDMAAMFIVRLGGNSEVSVLPLRDWSLPLTSQDHAQVMLAFCDPSTLEEHPGWPLRNLLTLAAYHWVKGQEEVRVLCFRDRHREGDRDISHSLVLHLNLTSLSGLTECPKSVGWEKNKKGKLGSRRVDLSASMDPAKMADSAVDLNLKLMRWRILPSLDLDLISQTKCLLLGAGTLGCNVARCLMGWGVRHVTLVDSGGVSYSNPVRQSLFEFADCLEGGKPKAAAAAAKLQLIFPGMRAEGVCLSVPMPGHPVNSSEETLRQATSDLGRLEGLLDSHDVVFLLTDTRESRWLPTVMAAAKHKLVICAALGFDSYLVMRHGVKDHLGMAQSDSQHTLMAKGIKVQGNQLGCYFCNDVVAPGNSTRDRTLDQQCTVTRPGISMMASGLAAELMVSILQHPNRGHASAMIDDDSDDSASVLGIVPHQIRGFLSKFSQVMPTCAAFDKCTACSQTVLRRYREEGAAFLLNVFNNPPSYLEDLTGLTALHQMTFDTEVWDFSDNESVQSME